MQRGGSLVLSYGGGDAHPAIRELFGIESLGDAGAHRRSSRAAWRRTACWARLADFDVRSRGAELRAVDRGQRDGGGHRLERQPAPDGQPVRQGPRGLPRRPARARDRAGRSVGDSRSGAERSCARSTAPSLGQRDAERRCPARRRRSNSRSSRATPRTCSCSSTTRPTRSNPRDGDHATRGLDRRPAGRGADRRRRHSVSGQARARTVRSRCGSRTVSRHTRRARGRWHR